MKKNNFVHLRAQSSYSMLASTMTIDRLVELAAKYKMPALCLTDKANLFGCLEFSIAAQKQKIQPIHGSIFHIAILHKDIEHFVEILVLAKDQTGFTNLLKLLSLSFTKDNSHTSCANITLEELEQYNQGLVLLSGYTKGPIGKFLLLGEFDTAVKYTKKLQNIFADRLYFEIMRHDSSEEKQIESEYLRLADTHAIPIIATQNIFFETIDQHSMHDVLLCIAQSAVSETENRYKVSNQCYFKDQKEMIKLFSDLPDAIENTVLLSKRCSFICKAQTPALPNFTEQGLSETELIYKLSKQGLESRLNKIFHLAQTKNEDKKGIETRYFKRLDYELSIICKMNFAGYFLIVSDFIRWSKNNDIAVGPGRGSGAGSIIAWALEITDLDPIKFGLLFERFLNPERVSMPDFDIDFCQKRRQEVIDYVRSKHTPSRVGQIITFGKLQAKAVIKDVSRVLGLPYSIADTLTALVPFNAVNPVDLKQAIAEVAELKQAYQGKGLFNIDTHNELIVEVLSTALVLEGLPRHASIHAAGIVIGNRDLVETIPICRDVRSEGWITQYSMKYCELAGLVKFDFLGLQTLTLINRVLQHLKQENTIIDLDLIDLQDRKTFEMLSKGLSTGIFQFESLGMKNTLKKLQPDTIDDIIALGALYRPGPMDNIETYIDCKYDRQKPDYLHPLLTEILEPTYGVIIYQEQVMEIAKKLSGYSLANADILRRAMGKKVKSEMDAQKKQFISGALKNKVDTNTAESIFATVAKFAGYGFNKSHASAYGLISYHTAYLKANFPLEFFVASMNLDIDSSDKIIIFIQDAKNFDITIIPPDINLSEGYFSIKALVDKEDNSKSIIFGIGAIKGATIKLGDAIHLERQKNGEFKSIIDFVQRLDPKLINKKSLENIVKAGCFDNLHSNRNSLIHAVPKILSYCNSYHSEKNSAQYSLLSMVSTSDNIIKIEEIDDISNEAKSYLEFDATGLFLKYHPLSRYSAILKELNIQYSSFLETIPNGNHSALLAGVIVKKDSRMSPRGRFTILLISDPTGIFEANIYDDKTFQEASHLIQPRTPVVISVYVVKNQGSLRITINKMMSLEEAIQKSVFKLDLHVDNTQNLKEISELIYNDSRNGSSDQYKVKTQITLFTPAGNNFVAKFTTDNILKLDIDNVQQIRKDFCKKKSDPGSAKLQNKIEK